MPGANPDRDFNRNFLSSSAKSNMQSKQILALSTISLPHLPHTPIKIRHYMPVIGFVNE